MSPARLSFVACNRVHSGVKWLRPDMPKSAGGPPDGVSAVGRTLANVHRGRTLVIPSDEPILGRISTGNHMQTQTLHPLGEVATWPARRGASGTSSWLA